MNGARHLYVHLPFCASRCGYCAFVVSVGGLEQRDAYVDALLTELDELDERIDSRLDTVYFGGGTPTLMDAAQIGRILDRLGSRVDDATEVSIESNPETVTADSYAELVDVGVTRVSIGIQSFQPHLLRALDRRASAAQARAAIEAARAAAVASVSIDLLFAIPGQDHDDLAADLRVVAEMRPDHISWYELEVKPSTGLAARGVAIDEDFSDDAYHRIVAELEAGGYRWYETANFALPGHECRHNRAYWGAADYVGLGIGAVSTVGSRRWRNAADLPGYLAIARAGGAPRRSVETLDDDTRRRERWMLGLRLDEPLSVAWAGDPDHPDALAMLEDAGLLEVRGDHLRLTRSGRFMQNAVLGKLMEYA